MDSDEIRKRFIDFFEKRGHAVVPSSSLIPDDPSVLLTSAGMQQFKPYFTGEADPKKDFAAESAASIQKCFRTSDIDEVGDESHLTFFEMMGNFSFGGYFKEEAIKYAFDFITKEMSLPVSYVTIFRGSDRVDRDDESYKIWESLGVKDIREDGMEEVFWGPTGTSGPCGPTTEIYCKNAVGMDVEIWNIVFNEFFYPGSREELLACISGKELKRLETPGVDTGMGFERLVMVVQGKRNVYETDLFRPVLDAVPSGLDEQIRRIIADHVRGSVFLIADGVRPSNKEAGYVLRRLLRRVFVYEQMHPIARGVLSQVIRKVQNISGAHYPEIVSAEDIIKSEIANEQERFAKTLKRGLSELSKLEIISAKDAFHLYESFGLPYEIIKEVGQKRAKDLTRDGFDELFKKHQEISRAGQEKKFGGHGLILNTGELKASDKEELDIVTRLHSATHLMHAALRKILGDDIRQAGSDITRDRTRFDFTFDRKLSEDEIKKVEEMVNKVINDDYKVEYTEMPYEEAVKGGALSFFKQKYPDIVKVFSFVDKNTGEVFSKELCGGPHVTHTQEIGKFSIIKQEASSAGVRRVRAEVEV